MNMRSQALFPQLRKRTLVLPFWFFLLPTVLGQWWSWPGCGVFYDAESGGKVEEKVGHSEETSVRFYGLWVWRELGWGGEEGFAVLLQSLSPLCWEIQVKNLLLGNYCHWTVSVSLQHCSETGLCGSECIWVRASITSVLLLYKLGSGSAPLWKECREEQGGGWLMVRGWGGQPGPIIHPWCTDLGESLAFLGFSSSLVKWQDGGGYIIMAHQLAL